MIFLVVAAAVVGGAVGLAFYGSIPPLIGALVGINLATIVLYGYDKAIAGGTRRRVPENVLHLVAIAGGSPGALLAQVLFRHKTVKASLLYQHSQSGRDAEIASDLSERALAELGGNLPAD